MEIGIFARTATILDFRAAARADGDDEGTFCEFFLELYSRS